MTIRWWQIFPEISTSTSVVFVRLFIYNRLIVEFVSSLLFIAIIQGAKCFDKTTILHYLLNKFPIIMANDPKIFLK